MADDTGPSEEELRALARTHTEDAIATLAEVMLSAETPPASRISAAVHLMDRGYGKSGLGTSQDESGDIIVEVRRFGGNNSS